MKLVRKQEEEERKKNYGLMEMLIILSNQIYLMRMLLWINYHKIEAN
jgi:hypothetical protein